MKKKLIQILMLLVATVSVGSFTSCKDTNEDLYNELRSDAFDKNASLQQALDAEVAKLKALIASLKQCDCKLDEYAKLTALDDYAKKTDLDAYAKLADLSAYAKLTDIKDYDADIATINALIAGLTSQMGNKLEAADLKDIQDAIDALEGLLNGINARVATLEGLGLQGQIDGLDGKLNALSVTVAENKVAQDALKELITKLEGDVEKLQNSDKDLTARLLAAEQAIESGKAEAEKITKLIETAQTTANDAKTLAQQAFDKAEEALKLADKIDKLTDDLALEKGAKELAQKAFDKATSTYELAIQLQTLAGNNKEAIEQLQKDVQGLRDLIDANKDKIADHEARIKVLEEQVKGIAKNAEDIAQLKKDLADINTTISVISDEAKDALKAAEAAAADAKANHALIETLQKEVTENATNIASLKENLKTTKDEVSKLAEKYDALSSQVTTNKTNIENLQKAVEKTNDAVDKLETKYENLKQELGELKGELATVKADCEANLIKAKAYTDEQVAAAQLAITNSLYEKLKEYATANDLKDLEEKLANYATVGSLNGYATKDDLQKAIDELQKQISDNSSLIAVNQKDIEWLKSVYNALDEKINKMDFVTEDELKVWMDNLKNATEAEIQKVRADIYKDLLEKLKASVDDATADIINNNTNNVNININIGGGSGSGSGLSIDDVKDLLKILENNFNSELSKIKADIDDLMKLKARVKALEQLTGPEGLLRQLIGENTKKIGDLNKEVKKINDQIDAIKANIKGLRDHVTTIENQLNTIIPRFWKITSEVSAMQDYLRSQVTGLIVQGTNNPMFGTFSIPANIQSNVLVAYYGKLKKPIEFPSTDDAYYVRQTEVLTAKDWEMINGDNVAVNIKANRFLMNEDAKGNASAGKVFVTVNPTTKDFTGTQLSIVNSQDKPSYIKLSELKKSDETLQFGFSRAATNGFYEADAYVARGDLENNVISVDEQQLTAIADEARTKLGGMAQNFFNGTGQDGNLAELATKVYQIIREVKIDQSGLKCPFTDVDGNAQAIYSQYNMAAFVMQPLHLKSLKDLHYATIPGYEQAMAYIMQAITGTLQNHVSVLFRDLNNSWKVNKLFTSDLYLQGLEFINMSENYIAHFEARLSNFTLNGVSYTMQIPATGSVDVRFDKNLTAGGSAVVIPAEAVFDKDNIDITKTTIVINGDVTTGMGIELIIPAVGGDGVISAYVCMNLIDSSVNLTAGKLVLTTPSGTYDIANYTAGNLATAGCTTSLVLGYVTGTNGTVSLPVATLIAEDLRNLIGSDLVNTLKNMTKELDQTLAKINKYEGIINGWIDAWVNKYLINYLDKINHTTTYFINSINRRFGPFMTASNDSKGFKVMSTDRTQPTVMDQKDLKLYPTTKNMELIVPIARKHVAVTNVLSLDLNKSVQSGTIAKSVLDNANAVENFNTVFDGTKRVLPVTGGFVPGYIYEVAYSVLDFEGNISTQKYYLRVK